MTTTTTDVFLLSSLDDVYGVMRRVQGEYNVHPKAKKTKCIGSGNCCRIGLVIPLMECYNIAKQLRREYWIRFENESEKKADQWYGGVITSLKNSFDHPDWTINDEMETSGHCAFFSRKDGCTIYEYRPFICRAYGTIAPVDITCPRNRDENGNVIIFLSNEIDKVIERFDKIVEKYGETHPDLNYSVYMPFGVLRFLLQEDDFRKFVGTIDPKYAQAIEGYHHQLWKVREEAENE